MLQIIKTKKIKARKDYTCHICGGIVAKGDYYLSVTAKEDGKMVRYHTHEGCLLHNAKPIEEQPKAKTEDEYLQQIHSDVMYRLQAFDFQKNMQMSLAPLMIKCIAWEYAMKARDLCAEMKISETRKTARYLTEKFKEFDRDLAKWLRNGSYLMLQKEAQKLKTVYADDFSTIYYTAKNMYRSDFPNIEYVEMRVNAVCSMVMIKVWKKINKWSDEQIIKRFGANSPRSIDPTMDDLYNAMDAFAGPDKLKFNNHLNNAVNLIFNHLMKVKFTAHETKR